MTDSTSRPRDEALHAEIESEHLAIYTKQEEYRLNFKDLLPGVKVLFDDIAAAAIAIALGLRSFMRSGRASRPFCLGILDGPKAKAFVPKKRGIVADHFFFTTGLFGQCHGLAAAMLADPALLPEIGNPGSEIARPLPEVPAKLALPVTIQDEELMSWSSAILPNCKHRAAFARYLATEALKLIVLHELGHLYCGHRDPDDVGVSLIDIDDEQDPRYVPRELLEFDADLFSVRMRSKFLWHFTMSSEQYEELGWPAIPRRLMPLVIGAMAGSLAFGVFSQQPSLSYASKQYPNPAVRALMMYLCLSEPVKDDRVLRQLYLRIAAAPAIAVGSFIDRRIRRTQLDELWLEACEWPVRSMKLQEEYKKYYPKLAERWRFTGI